MIQESIQKQRSGNGELSVNALRVMRKRYLHPREETWEHVCRRVARCVAKADPSHEEEFFETIFDREFIPNSPTIRNTGLPDGQLSACFVIGPEGMAEATGKNPDSLAVMNALKTAASEVTKSGGGVGVHYGAFRPKGMKVRAGAHGKALGPISFMESLNDWTRRLTQAGFREAAMMSILPIWHPDVVEFILCKQREGTIHNTNISLAADDAFLDTVKMDGDYELRFPGWVPTVEHFPEDFRGNIRIEDGHCFVRANTLMNLICLNAWRNGDPGFFFVERENRLTPWHLVGITVRGTNPCGEQDLPDWGSCNLGHIVLGRCVKDGLDGAEIDWAKIKRLVKTGVRFLDNVISVNCYPLPEITERARRYRNIGLGVVGWADMLLALGIAYGSKESYELANDLMAYIYSAANLESVALYEEKGGDQQVFKAVGRRNLVLLTVAPTGTTSQLVDQHGGGIEPIYAPTTWRYDHIHPEGYQMIVPGAEKPWFRSAINHDPEKQVTIEQHVQMQAAFQKHVDAAISKTVNLPNSATVEDVRAVYLLAYETGCKGITIYRDGSRQVEVLTTKKKDIAFDPTLRSVKKKKEEETPTPYQTSTIDEVHTTMPRPKPSYELPEIMEEQRLAFRDGSGNRVLLHLGFDPETGKPIEVSVNHGKTDPELIAMSTGLAITISVALQEGIDPERLAHALRGIKAGWANWARLDIRDQRRKVISSVPDAIAAMLERHREGIFPKEREEKEEADPAEEPAPGCMGDPDPEPQNQLSEIEIVGALRCKKCFAQAVIKDGGCLTCRNCLASTCS